MLPFAPEQHFEDESLHGYLVRFADENSLDSVGQLLRPLQINYKASFSDNELAVLSDAYGMELSKLHAMSGFEAFKSSVAAGVFLRRKGIGVCPACLAESAYIRQAWHHELVVACTQHDCLLVTQCPECEAPITLRGSSFSVCRCGCDLLDIVTTPADESSIFVANLLAADPLEQRQILRLKDESPNLDELDRFLIFLANLSLAKPQRRNAAISVSSALEINRAIFAIAADFPERFRAFVEARVAYANGQKTSRYISNLGTWYRDLHHHFSSPAYRSIREIVYRVIIEKAQTTINRRFKQIDVELMDLKSIFTAAETARALKSSPDRVVSYVKQGKLAGKINKSGRVEYCLVDRATIEAEQLAADEIIHGRDLLAALNISKRVRERLLECGALRRVTEAELPLFARGQYRKSDVTRLVDSLSENCTRVEAESVLSLDEICGRTFTSEHMGELYRQIFSGQIKPVDQMSGVVGLAAFRFDRKDLDAIAKPAERKGEFTITDLTRLLPWKHETIKSWIENGHLSCRYELVGKRKQVVISLIDLIAFLSTYVVVADAAQRVGSKSVWLMQPLKSKGVLLPRQHVNESGAQRGLLFSVDALINVVSGRSPEYRRERQL